MRQIKPTFTLPKVSALRLPAKTHFNLSVQCLFGHVRTKRIRERMLVNMKKMNIFRQKNLSFS